MTGDWGVIWGDCVSSHPSCVTWRKLLRDSGVGCSVACGKDTHGRVPGPAVAAAAAFLRPSLLLGWGWGGVCPSGVL